MNFTYENQGDNCYLVAEIPLGAELDTMTLGMITNNRIDGLAHVIFTQLDSSKYVKFNITSYITLKQMFQEPINKAKLIRVFSGICNAVSNAEDYMIDLNELIYDIDKIYVDIDSMEVFLICVPVVDLGQNVANIGVLFKNIMFSAQFDMNENNDYVGKIINYLNSVESFSTVEFNKMLGKMKQDNSAPVPQAASAPQVTSAPPAAPVPQVVLTPQVAPAPQTAPPVMVQKSAPALVTPNIPNMQNQPKPGKEKKSRGLFGSKELKKVKEKPAKKEKKEKVAKRGNNMAMSNIAVPGQSAPIGAASAAANSSQAAIPTSPVIPAQPQMPATAAGNFGETTVLNAGMVGETTVLSPSQMETVQPYLIRIKTNERIALTKPVFRIGKEKSCVDYFVSDNTAVSRSHANIVNHDGRYFVEDMDSTNHTFINGQMIPRKVETEITHGAKIRFANEEFEFRTI